MLYDLTDLAAAAKSEYKREGGEAVKTRQEELSSVNQPYHCNQRRVLVL